MNGRVSPVDMVSKLKAVVVIITFNKKDSVRNLMVKESAGMGERPAFGRRNRVTTETAKDDSGVMYKEIWEVYFQGTKGTKDIEKLKDLSAHGT